VSPSALGPHLRPEIGMKRIAPLAILVLCSLAHADDAKLKPGLWEVTMTQRLRDGKDMTGKIAAGQDKLRAAMEKMSPEQREKMQAMMAQHGVAPGGSGGVNRICVSPAMAAGDKAFADPQNGCDPAKFSHSGHTTSYEFSCTREGHSSSGTGTYTVNGDTGTSVIDIASKDGEATHTMHMESTLKFIGSDCQGVKPFDQAMKAAQAAK
jgi:uncharacterized protein DUF3617